MTNVSDEMDRLGLVAEDFLPFDPDDVEQVEDTFFDDPDFDGPDYLDDDWLEYGAYEAYTDMFMSDPDPSPYEGTYSED